MPKQGTRLEIKSFAKGLITEANYLNFPEDASLDELNFEVNRDGTRDRRLGMDLEDGYVWHDLEMAASELESAGSGTYKWLNAGGIPLNEFLVFQLSNQIFFFETATDITSDTGYLGMMKLDFDGTKKFSFASVDGKLVIVGNDATIAIVEYNSVAGTFSKTYSRLTVRDIWGVEETLGDYETDSTYRGATNDAHTYNLYNQSWGVPRKGTDGNFNDPLTTYLTIDSKYPSNSEQVWTGLVYQAVTSDQQPFERMYPNLYPERFGAENKSAKGYFIIDLLNRGNSRLEQLNKNYTKYPKLSHTVTTLPSDTSSGGASVIAEFAGRVFYSGFAGTVSNGDVRSPNLTNYVAFSQVVKSIGDITKCYQSGDPTSRDDNDLIDSDGGTFRVDGAKDIKGMINIGTHILILADNGIWSVTGGSNYGFSATNYKLDKVSSFGCFSANSIVLEGLRTYYWGEAGIYVIAKNQYGDLSVDSITDKTIQKFYEELPVETKNSSAGFYDIYNKKIKWIYHTGTAYTSDSVTTELILDTVTGAFYPFRLAPSPNYAYEIGGIFGTPAYRRGVQDIALLAGTADVYVNDLVVGSTVTVRDTGLNSIKYILINKVSDAAVRFTFCMYNNTNFKDWEQIDGVGADAAGYLLTGCLTGGDSAIPKQTPYVVVHMKRTEKGVLVGDPLFPSGCIMRCQWDWTNSIVSRRWSSPAQVYRYNKLRIIEDIDDTYDTGYQLVSTKNKVRGRGKAFSLYFETEAGKDCQLLGWSITTNANSVT